MKRSQDSRTSTEQREPFLELRVGGVHLTICHFTHRLITLATAVAGGGATWLLR
ncbi:hypothetical protein ACFYO0_25880 [Streptomyces sp. NPDC006365]|uniref:hypothetical protein n=1 Tax=Streptomyces sp. NPDC006365 TaxID=3364744 RepID=UPI0036884EB6